MKESIQIIREVFSEIGKNHVILPERTVIDLNNGNDSVLFMPAYLPKEGDLGIKIVTVFPSNISRNMPTISAVILLVDQKNGQVISAMEGGYITALRTGAVSGVATDLLARQDAQNLGIFGAGVQARSQIEAMLEVREIKHVVIYDITKEFAIKLADDMNEYYGDNCYFQPVETTEEAVVNSDIIVTATTSKSPVFDGSLVKKGTHINSIGSFKPQNREVDDLVIQKAKIFVDSYDCSLKEAGDLIIPLEKGIISRGNIKADLGELVLGKKKGRENDQEITFFKSVGMAVQDIAVARTIDEKARKKNMGIDINNL